MKKKKTPKNNNKKINIIAFIFNGIFLITSVLLAYLVINLDVLPTKYLVLVLGVISILNIVSITLNVLKKIHNKIKIVNMVVCSILSILFGILSFHVHNTDEFLEDMDIDYKTMNYVIVVLRSTEYDELDDLKESEIGYLDNESEGLNEALIEIKKVVSGETKPFTDLNELKEKLEGEEISAMYVEESYYKMLKDTDYDDEEEKEKEKENSSEEEEQDESDTTVEEDISEFEAKTKIIYSVTINMKTGKITKQVEDVTMDPFNIYISGIDTYGKISSVSRTDVNMVVTVNPVTHQILLTSIPRDYYVQLHNKKGLKDKLTHSGIYGIDTSVKTIEDLFGIDINYYFKVNFTSVVNIVEALGGVEVYSDYTFTSKDGYRYTKGYNSVNGKKALSFVRERKHLPGGDRQRIKDQQAMIDAMFRKAINPSIIIKYSSLLNSVKDNFVTNMSADEITNLVKMQLDSNAKWTITSNSVEGYDSSNYTYSAPSQKLYVMTPKKESVEEATNLIKSVTNGEKLEASYAEKSSDVHSVKVVPKPSSGTSSKKKSITNKNTTTTSKKEESKDDKKEEEKDKETEKDNNTTDDTTEKDDSSKDDESSEKQDGQGTESGSSDGEQGETGGQGNTGGSESTPPKEGVVEPPSEEEKEELD